MKNTPSASDHGSDLPELEVDELVAQRAAPHMPQPAFEVEHESRSVVICDPESDEDGPTPARGTRSPFVGAASSPETTLTSAPGQLPPVPEPPSAPLSAPAPAARPRQLEEYARRREKTVVLDRKRSVPPNSVRPAARQATFFRQHWRLLAAVAGICALAFAVGGLLSHFSTRKLSPPSPLASKVPPAPTAAPARSAREEPALAAPVKLIDLPIETNTDSSADLDAPAPSRTRPDRSR